MTTEPKPDTEDTQYVLPWYPPGMKRAAIYARVSTTDRGQDPETQLRPLREYAARRGFAIAEEFVDQASGTRSDRERFKRLFEPRAAASSMSSWSGAMTASPAPRASSSMPSRNSTASASTSSATTRELTPRRHRASSCFASWRRFAEFERSLIAERVKAGMQRAKAQGKHTGRPALPTTKRRQIEELHRANPKRSLRSIAKEVKVAPETVRSQLRSMATKEALPGLDGGGG